jgi:hypothetical protein
MWPNQFGAFLKKDGKVLKAKAVTPASLNPNRFQNILMVLINVPFLFLFPQGWREFPDEN